MTKTALVFDFDGVIADSLPVIYRGVTAVCRHGKVEPPPLGQLCNFLWSPWENSYVRMGVNLSSDELWRVYNDGLGNYNPDIFSALPPILEKLTELGIPMAVLSANRSERVDGWLHRFNLHRLFSQVLCVNGSKVLALRNLANDFGLKSENLFYLGDMISDMKDAKEAGVRPIGFCAGYGHPDFLYRAGAELVIFTHLEIFSLLTMTK